MSAEADNPHPPQSKDARPSTNEMDEGVFGNSSNKKVAHGFHLQIQTQVQKARKRKRGAKSPNHISPSMSLSSSSSSSSDEDDETKRDGTSSSRNPSTELKEARAGKADISQESTGTEQPTASEVNKPPDRGPQQNHNTHPHQQHSATHHPIQQQPEGWRVKLYRLNADGSWDDCGTGRILCLYKQTPKAHEDSGSTASSPNPPVIGDALAYQELGEPTLCMHAEVSTAAGTAVPRILLRTRILLRDAYQRQGDNIITWCEPYLEEGNPSQGVDLALSFQDNAGCLDIWRQITQVQSKAADLFRRNGDGERNSRVSGMKDSTSSSSSPSNDGGTGSDDGSPHSNNNGNSVADVAHAVAAAHHANLQRQQQREMWVNVASEAAQHHLEHQSSMINNEQHFEDSVGGMVAGFHDSNSTGQTCNNPPSPQLPNPPTLANLEEIADTIAAVQHIQQRESLAMCISQNECSYLKSLLSLFPSAESRGDYGSLATLAACVKTILLLNDPAIIELIVSDELIFEDVCSTLEYDPDLRDKANHRWFLRERAKFRTVALMEDEELIAAIHRSFRVNYLRDTLLRPTMDESSLSTLSSLQTFTHADVVKGVTMSPAGTDDKGELLKDSYLAKVIRTLGRELRVICEMEWQELEASSPGSEAVELLSERRLGSDSAKDPSTIVASGTYPQSQKMSTIWKQHLAPQDGSLVSRRLRRRGALSFLRELFNMVRVSLQQSDKDDFFAVLVSMEVDLAYGEGGSEVNPILKDGTQNSGNGVTTSDFASQGGNKTKSLGYPKPVNLLSLLGTVLSDPSTDVTEKGFVLEIIAGIAMHDPSLIRRRCLDFYVKWTKERHFDDNEMETLSPTRPNPNEQKQIMFRCPPNDLLAALLFLLAVETDAGVLLQVSEIMRIILDTDMMGDHAPMGASFADEAEGVPQGSHTQTHEHHHHGPLMPSTDQNQFLSMFYDQYVQWLAAPFQYTIFHPVRRVPHSVLCGKSSSARLRMMIDQFDKCAGGPLLSLVPPCAIRHSFAIELLSFCVRAHLYRMKCYLLRSRVLGNVLKLLRPVLPRSASGERCLKLAALRFLRAILSVNDEFYHRHIVQHDLFSPVFATFRANPVGDNLVSSAIVEMCDFIHTENIKSLIEYIVTKHLTATNSEAPVPSLEDVSSPYVSTLTVLRKAYQKNLQEVEKAQSSDSKRQSLSADDDNSRYFHGDSSARSTRVVLNEKALEDQRKFREMDQEESYFETDDDDGSATNAVPPAVEVAPAEPAEESQRAPRLSGLSSAPVLHSAPRLLESEPNTLSNSSFIESETLHESSEKEIVAET